MTEKATPLGTCNDCGKRFYLKYKLKAHETVKNHTVT